MLYDYNATLNLIEGHVLLDVHTPLFMCSLRLIIISGIEAVKRVAAELAAVSSLASQAGPPSADPLQIPPDVLRMALPWQPQQQASQHDHQQREHRKLVLRSQLGDISSKGYAIFYFLMSTNHMTILANTGRFLDTGGSNEVGG